MTTETSHLKASETRLQRFQRIAFILFAFGAALLVGTLCRVYDLWTGHFPTWPTLLIAALIGLLCGFAFRRVESFRLDKIVSIGCVLLTLLLFWDVQAIIDYWKAFFQASSITYAQWMQVVILQSILWLAPPVVWTTFTWMRAKKHPKGRLSIFVASCSGIILTHFLVGRIATSILLLLALLFMVEALFLICSSTLTNETLRRRLTYVMPLLGILLIAFSPTISNSLTREDGVLRLKNMPEFLRTYPFAPIAAQDVHTPLIPPSKAYIQQHGAYLRTDDKNLIATLELSKEFATILKPAPDARRGFRPLINATEDIHGQYDVLWVELPPAWQPEEQDYFDKGVVKSLLDTVNENGYLIYHMDIRPLTLEALLTRAEALAVHFPYIQLWGVENSTHWQLIASRKAPPKTVRHPLVQLCIITTDLRAMKRPEDELGFRLFETWHARKTLFQSDRQNTLVAPLIKRITESSAL
ncbi:MAG: hypothetical protein Q4C03_01050 [bacterium]|nr:hypothetical protein [bacterium]